MPDLDLNLMQPPAGDLDLVAPPPKKKKPLQLRGFDDTTATRKAIYANVLEAINNVEPTANQTHTLKLTDVDYADPEEYSKADQKKAILGGQTLGRRLRGTWQLYDNATGQVLDQRKQVVATVPFLTHRGTYIHGGSEYTLRNQQRLNAGSFARVKDNGEIEAHANVLPGKGVSHRYHLDPAKGIFYIDMQQAKIPLMPLVKAMGATPRQLRAAWGDDLYVSNYPADEASALTKLKAKVLRKEDLEDPSEDSTRAKLVKRFEAMELDPEVTQRTLGHPHRGINLNALLDITTKLKAISTGKPGTGHAGQVISEEPDDRDALHYQHFLGPEDLFAERISKDHGRLRKNLLFKMAGKGDLSRMPSSALKPQVEAALLSSGLGQPLEEINPAEIFDKQFSISRLGEGGIPSMDAVPDEARNVQPSHMGFIDPTRTPESGRVGVDLYLAHNARKGNDGQLYTQFKDPRTGKIDWYSSRDLADKTISPNPNALTKFRGKRVPVQRGGQLGWAKKGDVDLVIPSFDNAMSPLANLIPMKNASKGQRMMMGARYLVQSLPLTNPEAPLVQGAIPGTQGQRSYEEEYAKHMGALHAARPGRVLSVSDHVVTVGYPDGTGENHELYHHFPFNRKTYLHQVPVVTPGQSVKAGDLLARSNYTDHRGTTALGANLRTAYMSWGGYNFEDAVVISESAAAEKLKSEHMYQHALEQDERTKTGKRDYTGLFPSRFDKKILGKLDDKGVIKEGMTVEYGEPLILAARERDRAENKLHKRGQAGYSDASITWDHEDPGIVTDVVQGKNGPVVLVKSQSAMKVGDKLSGRYGDKGVVSKIVPDDQMPRGADGKPFEILLSPTGLISRTNASQKAELWLGKTAAKRGQPIKVDDFDDSRDLMGWVNQQLRQEGLSDFEDVHDPNRDEKIKNIATGSRFFMKLHHTSESKGQARGGGGYTSEDTPAKGGYGGSKRVSMLDTNALLAHGAIETLHDVTAVKGGRNENYWLQYMQGNNPPTPKVPMVFEKFVNQLKGAGVNVVPQGNKLHIMALTDPDLDSLAGTREIKSGETVNWDNTLRPVPGGLFDKALTGGHGGRRWSAIKLHEPMPNPVMEEPIRRLLGLTQKQFEATLSGEHTLGQNGTGPQGIANALAAINIPHKIDEARAKIEHGSMAERDLAVRQLGYLKAAEKMGLHPKDWMLKRAPVLPPAFRPISMMQNNLPLVSDPNYLYKELIEANNNLRSMSDEVGSGGVGAERLAVYHAFKAVTGLGDPISQKSKDKNVQGFLKTIFGSSPKFGTVQRKLISTTVDNVGRAVITPNPEMDMDSIGLPEDMAFDVYKKFVARRLRRAGMPLVNAMQQIKDRTKLARQALVSELEMRPVYVDRAPVLHKFGVLAFRPRLIPGHTMQVSPLIVKGFNADFDGDTMNFHVPTEEGARKEAYQRLLPSRTLLSSADFRTPVHMPVTEYQMGVYQASKHRSTRPISIYRRTQDVREAHERGTLRMSDPVKVMEE